MKKLFLMCIFLLSSFYSFGNSKINEKYVVKENLAEIHLIGELIGLNYSQGIILDKKFEKTVKFIRINSNFYNCEITIKGNFEGTKVDVVVTIYDVSWAGCQTLKLAVKVGLATI